MSSCDRLTIDLVAAAEKKQWRVDRYRDSAMVMTVMMDDDERWTE